MAQDKGYPPLSRTVEVQIDVVDRANNPPVWDNTVYGPIYVKENMPVGGKVVSIKARSVFRCARMRGFLFVSFFFQGKFAFDLCKFTEPHLSFNCRILL